MTRSGIGTASPDRRDGIAYVIDEEVSFAVEVALAAGRPLLLRGEPGSGKSSLAAYVARQRDWRYYEHVVTSRTTPRDLLWSFDSVRRLGDAQALPPGQRPHDADYVEPGVLWWAFDQESAARRGSTGATAANDPQPDNAQRNAAGAVVLIDEIDKADPDLPNGLLVPLGSNEFAVPDAHTVVQRRVPPGADRLDVLIVVTTNEERDLPEAFMRRCIVSMLPEPSTEHLIAVAREHLRAEGVMLGASDERLVAQLADVLMAERVQAKQNGVRPASTAEFLDALHALRRLDIGVADPRWHRVRELTMAKSRKSP